MLRRVSRGQLARRAAHVDRYEITDCFWHAFRHEAIHQPDELLRRDQLRIVKRGKGGYDPLDGYCQGSVVSLGDVRGQDVDLRPDGQVGNGTPADFYHRLQQGLHHICQILLAAFETFEGGRSSHSGVTGKLVQDWFRY